MGMDEATLKKLQSASPEDALASIGITAADLAPLMANDPYSMAKAEFRGIPRRESTVGVDMSLGGDAVAAAARGDFSAYNRGLNAPRGEKLPFIESSTGKILYENGAIWDPQTQTTLFPPTMSARAEIAGTDAWVQAQRAKWSDEKVAEWRKRLANQGYQVAETGKWADDLATGLMQYHALRYANFGTPTALTPKSGQEESTVSIRETFDKQELKATTKSWGYDVFGEDLDDDEAEFFADRILDVAQKLAKKHEGEWTTEQIHTGAQMRVQRQFAKDPNVSEALDDMEELEGNTAIRDSVVSISQLAGM